MWLPLLMGAALVRAGYITVGMSEPRQCNTTVVEWYGDDGPYHLLLTPTTFVSHGYNVWVPTIPNGTNSYNLSINQPEGMQFMVTVWGKSGIEYAGTTDVLTVLPSLSNNKTCFLSDAAISNLYRFAFNISNAHNDWPPQCSNLSLSWPTSLESDIPEERRRREAAVAGLLPPPPDSAMEAHLRRSRTPTLTIPPRAEISSDTSSSNKTSGNTTNPPTLFGIIPLGNSFNIPVTFARNSKFAEGLPEESLSDTPTTWTSKGVTHMNWTVSLAKGTRFILVAGIGSQEEWASGGSSEMLTVGQGGVDCFNGGNDAKITATATSNGPLSRPPTSQATSTEMGGTQGKQSKPMSWFGILLACIFSIIGTLLLVTLCFCGCRVGRQRRKARQEGLPKPSILAVASFGRLDKRRPQRVTRYHYGEHGGDTQMDLIARDDVSESTPPSSAYRRPRPISAARPDSDYASPTESELLHEPLTQGYSASSLTSRSPIFDGEQYAYPHPGTYSGYTAVHSPSPLASPVRERAELMARQSSVDGLVHYPPLSRDSNSSPSTRRSALVLQGERASLDDPELNAEDITNLKRETLAIFGRASGESSRPGSAGPSGPSRRTTLDDEAMGADATYVVHRDAGRVETRRQPSRMVELPPRYDEVNWDAETMEAGVLRPPTRAYTVDAANVPLPPSPVSETGTLPPGAELRPPPRPGLGPRMGTM